MALRCLLRNGTNIIARVSQDDTEHIAFSEVFYTMYTFEICQEFHAWRETNGYVYKDHYVEEYAQCQE